MKSPSWATFTHHSNIDNNTNMFERYSMGSLQPWKILSAFKWTKTAKIWETRRGIFKLLLSGVLACELNWTCEMWMCIWMKKQQMKMYDKLTMHEKNVFEYIFVLFFSLSLYPSRMPDTKNWQSNIMIEMIAQNIQILFATNNYRKYCARSTSFFRFFCAMRDWKVYNQSNYNSKIWNSNQMRSFKRNSLFQLIDSITRRKKCWNSSTVNNF